MMVNLSIDNDYIQSYCVLVRALPESLKEKDLIRWEFVHKYPDLLRAEKGMMEIANRKTNTCIKSYSLKLKQRIEAGVMRARRL